MRIFWGIFDYVKNTNTGITGVSRKERQKEKVVKMYLIILWMKTSKTWIKKQIQVPEAERVPQNDSNKTHTNIYIYIYVCVYIYMYIYI